MPTSNQCASCLYNLGGSCFAYPEKIPYEIISGQIEHNAILPDQVGDYIWRQFSEKGFIALLDELQQAESE